MKTLLIHARERWKTSRYLVTIVLWIAVSLLALLILFSTVVFVNVENAVMRNEEAASRRLLLQVRYNIDQMQEMIEKLALSAYIDQDTVSVMYEQEPDYEKTLKWYRRLRTIYVDLNPYVHSIIVMNKHSGLYSSTSGGLFRQNGELDHFLLQQEGAYLKLKPLYREVTDTGDGSNGSVSQGVFSYILFDTLNGENKPDGMLVVNVRSDWLLDSIRAINAMDSTTGGQLFLIDGQSRMISVGDADESLRESVRREYLFRSTAYELADGGGSFSFVMRHEGKEHLVTSTISQKTGWIVLKSQPFLEVYAYILQLRNSILVISLLFATLALLVSLTISGRIYRPIRNLLRDMGFGSGAEVVNHAPVDEIMRIRTYMEQSSAQLAVFQEEHNTTQRIRRNYFLRSLLLDSTQTMLVEGEDFSAEYGVQLPLHHPLRLALIWVDGTRGRVLERTPGVGIPSRPLLVQSLERVARVLGPSEVVEIAEDLVLVCPLVEEQLFRTAMKELQQQVEAQTSWTLSITFGEAPEGMAKLSALYRRLQGNAMYSYVFGSQCLISETDVAQNNACTLHSFSATLERLLGEEIKAGNLVRAEKALERIVDEIGCLGHKNMMLSVMRLVNVISDAVEEMNRSRLDQIFTDYGSFQTLLDAPTLQELKMRCSLLMGKILDRSSDVERDKKSILVDAVREIVQAGYDDNGLCLNKIADLIRMSPSHVGRVFRTSTGMSVAEYITEVRMVAAEALLRESEDSIGGIVVRVGLENESYFYRLFKKRFGATPKDYRRRRALEGNAEGDFHGSGKRE